MKYWISKYLLQNLAYILLVILGYDCSVLNTLRLKKDENIVMIFPHTSKLDTIIFILAKIAYDAPFYALTREYYYNHIFLKYIFKHSFIPIKNKGDGGSGGVTTIIDSIKKYFVNMTDGMVFVISPEGKLEKSLWKSGFYHIAKGINAKIAVMGFDFIEYKLFISKQRFDPNILSYDYIQYNIQPYWKDITPLHPYSSHPTPEIVDYLSDLKEKIYDIYQWKLWCITPIPKSRIIVFIFLLYWMLF